MYGGDIGTLSVKIWPSQTIFTASGDKGDQWRLARVHVVPDSKFPFELMVSGVVGTSHQGDIALDDFAISDGKCPGKTLLKLLILPLIIFFQFFPLVCRTLNLQPLDECASPLLTEIFSHCLALKILTT